MRFFRRRQTEANPVFLIGETELGSVSERSAGVLFDESLAEAERTRDDPAGRQFLGVAIGRGRLRAAAVVLLATAMLFIGRAAHLQVINGDDWRQLAEGNRVRLDLVPSRRGVIYDREHRLLAENVASFRLIAVPGDLPAAPDARVDFLSRLAAVIDADLSELLSNLGLSDVTPNQVVVLQEEVDYEAAMRFLIQAEYFPGVALESSTVRSYKTTEIPSLSHLLGYTGRISQKEYAELGSAGYRLIDDVGKAGVEKSYEAALRGEYGRHAVEVDALGREASVIAREEPKNGSNLVLSIDATLTAKIELILAERLGNDARAAVVVLDPNNGESIALVSTPSFDSNDFAGGIDAATYQALLDDPHEPLFNRAVAGTFPSGSTFKPVVAAAALSEGLIDRNSSFLSTGTINVGPWTFYDWKPGGHGVTNVTRAIAESINTFFYYIGGGYAGFAGLGVERLMSYADAFGFGAALGVDLPGEADGFLPSKAWKEEAKGERWYIGDTYNVSIGQGDLLVTPLQIAAMTSVFANGGTLYRPRVVAALEDEQGVRPIEPEILADQVVEPEVVAIVRQGLRQAVTSGSARRLLSLPVTSAGKTGTAQWSNVHPTHAWFTGFAPYEDPEIVVTVLVEDGGEGDKVAVPIAEAILRWWFTQYEVDQPVDSSLDAKTAPVYDLTIGTSAKVMSGSPRT